MEGNYLPIYTPQLAELICDKLACTTAGLKKLCSANKNFPDHSTIYRWLKDPDKQDFLLAFLLAREAQADLLYEEIKEIADTFDAEADSHVKIARDRLRMLARHWQATRLAPKKYGDRMEELNQAAQQEERRGNFIIWNGQKIPV